jgi:hypothetical protein
MKPPPDRAKDSHRQPGQPLNMVRGGAVCDPGQKGGHILKGSNQPAVCMPTVGTDTRPRYREAGKPQSPPSRHSVQWAQHRKGGRSLI